MSYLTISKQLKSIPFDKLFDIYEDAADIAEEGAKANVEADFQARLEQMERQYTATHEAPSEVSFADRISPLTYDKSEVRRKAGQKAITDVWMPRYKLGTILLSVMPQIMAWLVHKPLRIEEMATAEGKIDGLKIVKHIFDFNDSWQRGLYLFLMLDSRSSYIPSQYKGEGVQFCAMVPLILYAFKLHNKIPYSKWDKQNLRYVVNHSLCKAMLFDYGEPTREQLIQGRERGLTFASGEKAGQMRNATNTYKLWSTRATVFEGMPELVQSMLAQIWCAHPTNRTHYMVLDPKNWDLMPTPLITENIFKRPAMLPHSAKDVEQEPVALPWDC
jgi:hypothetical protein